MLRSAGQVYVGESDRGLLAELAMEAFVAGAASSSRDLFVGCSAPKSAPSFCSTRIDGNAVDMIG